MGRRRFWITVLFALASAAAGADDYQAEPDQVLVTYEATMGAKEISGVSRSLEWSVIALESDGARVELRVPIDSFDSGHREVDSLLRAASESKRYPFLEIEGVVLSGRFEGMLTLHGHSRPLRASFTIARHLSQLVAHTSFAIALDDFGIAIPRMGNRFNLDLTARLSTGAQAVLSGGAVSSSN
jgi:polyisoprenoid-binding protein YceI